MTITDLIKIANQAYDEFDTVASYFDEKTGNVSSNGDGDGLARFIVVELIETFDPEADEDHQLVEAGRVMNFAANQLTDAVQAFCNKLLEAQSQCH